MSDWTDELKQEVIEAYESAEPTPDNSIDIVNDLAEEYGKTPNGIRMILSKAGVYVKKTAKAPGTNADKPATKRISKDAAISGLTKILEDNQLKVDEDILSRLTGKAAIYFGEVISQAVGDNG